MSRTLPHIAQSSARSSDSRQEIVRERGNWLNEMKWHFWVTLTCRFPLSESRLRAAFDRFVDEIRRRGQGREPCYAYSVEGWPDRPHIHLLLYCRGRRRIVIQDIRESWGRFGYVDAELYDYNRGATAYMLKAIDGEGHFNAWDISNDLPPLRRRARSRSIARLHLTNANSRGQWPLKAGSSSRLGLARASIASEH